MSLNKATAGFLAKHNFRFFLAGIVVSILFLIFSKLPAIDGTLTGNLSSKSSFYQTEKRIEQIFQNHQVIHLKITPDQSSLEQTLAGLTELNSELESTFKLNGTASLLNFQKFFYLEKIDLTSPFSVQSENLKKIPFLKHLISRDGRSLLMEIKLSPKDKIDLKAFDELVANKRPGLSSTKAMSHLHIERGVAEHIESDLAILITLILVLSLLIILYTFRSFKVVLITLLTLFVTMSPILFLLSVFSIKINIVTVLAFPVVLILSLADLIHLVTGWQHQPDIEHVIEKYILPSFLTSLATMFAFLSFVDNDIDNLRQFGLVASVAVMVEFFMIFLYAPYLLTKLNLKHRSAENFMSISVAKLLNYKKQISYFFIFAFIVGVVLAPTLKFSTSTDAFFPRKSKVFMDHEELRQDFNSMLSMSVLVEAPVYPDVPGFQWDKADIGKVSYILANRIQKLPNVDSVQSINEIVDYYLYNGITMDKWKGVDFPNPLKSGSNYLITAKVKSADDINIIYPEVQKIAAKFGHRAKISFSSPVLLFNEIDQTLARELLLSIFTSSFSIIFIFYFLTRSIRNTLIALYANLIPIAFIVILFYITGLSLNLVTSLTSVICLGIVVDDTIHVLYRLCYRKEKDIAELGDGMITTTLILGLGFGSLVISSFEPTRVFGLISSLVFVIAVLSDLTLLSYGVITEAKEVENVS